MKMTKTLTLTWLPPDDEISSKKSNTERWIKLLEMALDNKIGNHHYFVALSEHTLIRRWRDQAAVDEWIEFMQYLAKKYNGKVIVGEIKDI